MHTTHRCMSRKGLPREDTTKNTPTNIYMHMYVTIAVCIIQNTILCIPYYYIMHTVLLYYVCHDYDTHVHSSPLFMLYLPCNTILCIPRTGVCHNTKGKDNVKRAHVCIYLYTCISQKWHELNKNQSMHTRTSQ